MSPDTPRPPDKWVTISEAVGLLSLSERTIRRYVADGNLSSRRERGRLWVNLADILPAPATPTPDTPDSPAKVAKLQAEIDRLQALLQAATEDRDYLRQALATALTTQQKLIEATLPTPLRQAQDVAARPRWRWPWSKTDD